MKAPHGYSEILRVYGDPKFSGEPDASVDPSWERTYMTLARDLPGVPKLYCHRLIVEPLNNALQRAVALGWTPRTAGCFAPRLKRGLTQVSIHTFGAAVDFDAAWNPLLVNCGPSDPRRGDGANCSIPIAVVDAFRSEGWCWGGDFATRFDPMHFQYATGY